MKTGDEWRRDLVPHDSYYELGFVVGSSTQLRIFESPTVKRRVLKLEFTMELPELTDDPRYYADCCCFLSTVLVDRLANLLPSNPEMTLSIGSGSGLLECLLMMTKKSPNVHAVEVSESVNKYIQDERMEVVSGSWALSQLAGDARAWLFVYSRGVQLVERYFRMYGDRQVKIVVWIGPLADLKEYSSLSLGQEWSFREELVTEVEAMIVWRRENI